MTPGKDPMDDPTSQWRELAAELAEKARALGVHRDALIEAGFTRDEAVGMCARFQAPFYGLFNPHGGGDA